MDARKRSVRCPGGEWAAVFWPDLVDAPIQADHLEFHWNGARVEKMRNCRTGAIFAL